MSRIDRAGTFRGHMVSQAVGISKNGHVQLEVELVATEYYDQESQQWLDWSKYEECELHGYLYLISKDNEPYKTAEQLKKALGWSGTDFDELDDADYSGTLIQFRVQMDTYEGKTNPKIAQIDHADATPGSSISKLDKSGIKNLNIKFAKALKALGGGTKPKAVPTGKPVPPKVNANSMPSPSGTQTQTVSPTPTPSGSTKSKAGKSKTGKSVAPETTTVPEKPAEVTEESGLPSVCFNADEAWAQVEANVDASVPKGQVEETWLKVVEDMGGPDTIETDSNWAGVRDIVLETLKQ